MKIVDRKTFLAMPEGTVYWKYEPCCLTELARKGKSIPPPSGTCLDGKPYSGDFYTTTAYDCLPSSNSDELFKLMDRMADEGVEVPIKYDSESRDGLYDEHQLFAVLDAFDVETMCRFFRGTDLT